MHVYPSVVSLSLTALPLAAVGVVLRWQQARFWLFSAGVFTLFALGPELRVFGYQTDISLPYDLLIQWEPLRIARTPARFTLLVMLCVSMLAALGTAALLERIKAPAARGATMALIIGMLGFELVVPPLHGGTPETVPSFYTDDTLQHAGALVALRDPDLEPYHDNMYLATLHERPVLFEQLAHDPPRSALLDFLRYGLLCDTADIHAPFAQWLCLTRLYDITHLAVYRHEWHAADFGAVREMLAARDFPLLRTTPTAELYRIPWRAGAAPCLLLTTGWSEPRLFADGSTAYRWMEQAAALRVFRNPADADGQAVSLRFQAHSFAVPRRLQVYVDGDLHSEHAIATEPTPVTLDLTLHQAATQIEFRSVEPPANPADYGYEENMLVSIGFSDMRAGAEP
jgi:hypothetical protein